MSDYDAFPLHDFRSEGVAAGDLKDTLRLPHNGTLTVHNRLCPSLVSGTGAEWLRVAKEIIGIAAAEKIPSDQRSLVALYQKRSDIFEQEWSVTQTVFNATLWNDHDCQEQTPVSMRAVHFAHSPVHRAIQEGRLPADWNFGHRADIASQFLNQWLQRCGKRKPFHKDASLLAASRGDKVDAVAGAAKQ